MVTVAGESLIGTPLKELLGRLDPTQFWQIHRATMVNVNEIRSVGRGLAGRMTLALKQRPEALPVCPNDTHLFKQL
ncbi:hypothetical protein BH11PSE10_BH11PSE10_15450 [soil metagenome]